jgi:tetratricopeptide (TPR) repeat protein
MRVDQKYCVNGSEYSGLMDDINNAIKYGSAMPNSTGFLQDLYAERGKIEFVLGYHQRAIEDLEHAVRLDPALASHLFYDSPPNEPKTTAHRCQWSVADFDELGKEYPADYRMYLFRGLDYERFAFPDHNEYYAKALVNFQKAIAANPRIGLNYYYLGDVIESTLPPYSQPTEADRKLLQAYGAALTLDPRLVPAYVARANIHTYLKHPNLALSDYDKAIELHPRDPDLYNRRAHLLMDSGKNREAIGDFTKAIDNCRGRLLQAYYEQRADVSMRVGDYAGAVRDSSESIRLILESQVPYLLGLKQFRKLYPEYSGLTDERLSAELHALLAPTWEYDAFAKRLVETTNETNDLAALFLSQDYARRGDGYWRSGHFKEAISDYQRIFEGLSHFIKEYSDSLDRWKPFFAITDGEEYIDVRTVDFSQPDLIKLWVKTVHTRADKPSTYSILETHINCGSKLIGIPSTTNYDAKGNVIGSVNTAGWQSILPDTLSEALYEGMCKD